MNKQDAIQKALESALDYSDYIDLTTELHKEEKATSQQDKPTYYEYSKLGLARMKRIYKKGELSPTLSKQVQSISSHQNWLLLTESWCGDASQTVPLIVKLAELNPLINIRIVLRDSNLELMDHYLTNGGRSIPKLIMFDEKWQELGTWGPRPAQAQVLLEEYKAIPEDVRPPYSEFSEALQKWYNEDAGLSTQKELTLIISGLTDA